MCRGLVKVDESPRAQPGSGPASLTPSVTTSRAFRLSNRRSRSTVEPGDGGYLGNVGQDGPTAEPLLLISRGIPGHGTATYLTPNQGHSNPMCQAYSRESSNCKGDIPVSFLT
jgi:hypothetical protein